MSAPLLHYCHIAVSPVRLTPSHRSEMVTQLLLGEQVEIITKENDWYQVKSVFDNYVGWVETKTLLLCDENFSNNIIAAEPFVYAKGNLQFPVLMGALLPCFQNKQFSIGEKKYVYEGNTFNLEERKFDVGNLIATANNYLNTPYLWGGRTPMGIDCSGFTQIVFKLNGITLLRDANQQAEQGEAINSIEKSTAGDLAFFENAEKKVTHVGLLIGENKIIHASGWVRIDTINDKGIWNEELKKYSHNLCCIRRQH